MQQQLATTPPAVQFTRSVAANVNYWQKRTKELTHHNLPALDRDRQNLYRAARYGLHLTETWQETVELILQSFLLIEKRGYWGEWIPILERLNEKGHGEPTLRGQLLDQLGIFYRYNRQLDKALLTHQEELQLGIDTKDMWRQAHASINLAAVYRHMYCFAEAETYLLEAEKAFQAIEAPLVKHAFVALEQGLLAQAQAIWSIAEDHLTHSVSLWREVNDPVYLANGLKLLGQVLVSQNKTEEALAVFHEALALNPEENCLDKSRLLTELGDLHFNQGNLDEARRLLLEADSDFLRQSSNLLDQAIITTSLGAVYLAQGQLEESRRTLQRSVALWDLCDDPIRLTQSQRILDEVGAALENRVTVASAATVTDEHF